MLQLANVHLHHGQNDDDEGITLTVRAADLIGFVADNRGDATTLCRMMAGTLPVPRGHVLLDDEDITGTPVWQRCHRGIHGIDPEVGLLDDVTVWQHVLTLAHFGARLSGRKARASTVDALDHCGLLDKANDYVRVLQGADRCRLRLAKAIAADPRLIVIDNLTAGLVVADLPLMERLIKRTHDRGIALIWVSRTPSAFGSAATSVFTLDDSGALVKMSETRD